MYDHPFQWGSKRNGPDLARVGGKYSDDWQRDHLTDPRVGRAALDHAALWLPGDDAARFTHIAEHMRDAAAIVGVPYTDEKIANARRRPEGAGDPRRSRRGGVRRSATRRRVRNFDGDPGQLTEADALIAYLQMLGTLVDFKLYDEKANMR